MKFLIFLGLVASCLAVIDIVDTAELVKDLNCITGKGYTQLIFRGLMSMGLPDPNAKKNLDIALKVDCTVYLNPCFMCGNAADQIDKTCDAILGTGYVYRPYLAIEDPSMWSSDVSANRKFVAEMVAKILSRKDCFDDVRFKSTKYEWEKILGADYSEYSQRLLWYISGDKKKNYDDFKPFGGWNAPLAKQYIQKQEVCDNMCNIDVQGASTLLAPLKVKVTVADQ